MNDVNRKRKPIMEEIIDDTQKSRCNDCGTPRPLRRYILTTGLFWSFILASLLVGLGLGLLIRR